MTCDPLRQLLLHGHALVLGPRCEVAVAWRAVVGGMVGVVVLPLLLLASLSLFVARSRSRRGGQVGGR